MAFDRNELDAPRDLFKDNAMAMGVSMSEKSGVPHIKLKESFSAGAMPFSPQAIASMGLKNILEPKEPAIELKPEDLSAKVEMDGAYLKDCRVGPKADSFFGACCTEVTNNVRGIAECLNGNPAINSQDISMKPQQLALDHNVMRPSWM